MLLLNRYGSPMKEEVVEAFKKENPKLAAGFEVLNNKTVEKVCREKLAAIPMKTLFREACKQINWFGKHYKKDVFLAVLGAGQFPTKFQDKCKDECYAFWLHDQLYKIGSTALQYVTQMRTEAREQKAGHGEQSDDAASIKSGPVDDENVLKKGKRKADGYMDPFKRAGANPFTSKHPRPLETHEEVEIRSDAGAARIITEGKGTDSLGSIDVGPRAHETMQFRDLSSPALEMKTVQPAGIVDTSKSTQELCFSNSNVTQTLLDAQTAQFQDSLDAVYKKMEVTLQKFSEEVAQRNSVLIARFEKLEQGLESFLGQFEKSTQA